MCMYVDQGICELTLYRVGCPPAQQTIKIGSQNGKSPYTCSCGKYVDASVRVQELIVDKLNEAELMETPVYDDPFTLTLEASLAVVMIVGKIGSIIACVCYLPPIIGFLLGGMAIQDIISQSLIKGAGGNGPHATPFSEMRIFALVIVLMRAGITLHPRTVLKEGLLTTTLCLLPYFAEFAAELGMGMYLLKWNVVDMGLLASILAALSPSLVIPGMINILNLGFAPRAVLSAAPLEVVMAIILYNVFASLEQSSPSPLYPWAPTFPLWANIVLIPVNILFSSVLGMCTGLVAVQYFKIRMGVHPTITLPPSIKRALADSTAEFLFILIVSAYFLYAICQPQYVTQTSGVLAAFVMMLTVAEFADPVLVHNLKEGLAGLWVFVEVILFTTVGINLTFKDQTGPLQSDRGISMADVSMLCKILFMGVLGRAGGLLCTALMNYANLLPHRRSPKYLLAWMAATLTFQWPKATVQATLGTLPLAMHVIPGASGLSKGTFILHATAFAVLLQAPIGVFLTALVGKPLATWIKEQDEANGVIDHHATKIAPKSLDGEEQEEENTGAKHAEDIFEIEMVNRLEQEDCCTAGRVDSSIVPNNEEEVV